MDGFKRVSSDIVFSTKLQRLLCFLRLKKLFIYYQGDSDNNEGYFFVQKIKSYPNSIDQFEVKESKKLILKTNQNFKKFEKKMKIIILCGRDIVADKELIKIYKEIIDIANSLGFMCYLKDHPSAIARLNVQNVLAEVIDPAMPVELLEDDFALAMGVASTGLLHFTTRAISIIKFLPNCEEETKNRRIAHLESMLDGKKVHFPENLEEIKTLMFEALIKNTRV